MGLVLTRKLNEKILIDGDIVITVVEVSKSGRVRLSIEAPEHINIWREELFNKKQSRNNQGN